MASAAETTQILRSATAGDEQAAKTLLPLVYDELRGMAGRLMRQERADHTLQPTALVHEAYLKLVDHASVGWEDHAHFLVAAAVAMRRILVDHARTRKAQKRGGGRRALRLDDEVLDPRASAPAWDHDDLDRALLELERVDEVRSRIVEMRYFGEMTVEEVSQVTGIAVRTVERRWRSARTWLYRNLVETESRDGFGT